MTVNSLSFMVFFLVVALCFYLLPKKIPVDLSVGCQPGILCFGWCHYVCLDFYHLCDYLPGCPSDGTDG